MQMTNWFPFFSMLFWCVTKVMGLGLAYVGLQVVCLNFSAGFSFTGLLFNGLVPLALGALLLLTEIVYDMATNEMRQRSSVAK
jgi:hypothetical protein